MKEERRKVGEKRDLPFFSMNVKYLSIITAYFYMKYQGYIHSSILSHKQNIEMLYPNSRCKRRKAGRTYSKKLLMIWIPNSIRIRVILMNWTKSLPKENLLIKAESKEKMETFPPHFFPHRLKRGKLPLKHLSELK